MCSNFKKNLNLKLSFVLQLWKHFQISKIKKKIKYNNKIQLIQHHVNNKNNHLKINNKNQLMEKIKKINQKTQIKTTLIQISNNNKIAVKK